MITHRQNAHSKEQKDGQLCTNQLRRITMTIMKIMRHMAWLTLHSPTWSLNPLSQHQRRGKSGVVAKHRPRSSQSWLICRHIFCSSFQNRAASSTMCKDEDTMASTRVRLPRHLPNFMTWSKHEHRWGQGFGQFEDSGAPEKKTQTQIPMKFN